MENTKDLALVKEKIKGMQAVIDKTIIVNDEALTVAADVIKNIKILAAAITKQKEEYTLPAKAIMDKAKLDYDPLIKECKNAEIVLKQRVTKYLDDENARKEIEKAKIAARVGEGKGHLKAETAVDKIENVGVAQTNVKTESGAELRVTKRRVAEITEPNLIPKEYWIIDEVRVRREALAKDKLGQEQIPGVTVKDASGIASY
jgi:hypothetical protein